MRVFTVGSGITKGGRGSGSSAGFGSSGGSCGTVMLDSSLSQVTDPSDRLDQQKHAREAEAREEIPKNHVLLAAQ
jgi:hypothetical protein